ncbi:ATP-binding protein [Rhizobium sp.]|uniref:ATP-binding protein n=1 Tax=Rhizobium sp. TaxID=391 RepID=UPI002AA771E5
MSLQTRLALAIGLSVTVLWLVAAAVTAQRLGGEMEEVFDDGLKATAQRLIPIVRHDLRERHFPMGNQKNEDSEDDDGEIHNRQEARYGENVTFIVRDRVGNVLFASRGADASLFPPFTRRGFLRTATSQLYYDASLDGNLTIAVSEPLEHRLQLFNKMLLGLVLPLILVIPFSLVVIILAVRGSLRPVHGLRDELAHRGAQDLSPLQNDTLPSELRPISAGINQLLNRLTAAFIAERAFAANAAHELRTPVAGAIAQAQRIRAETTEVSTGQRATEIEVTLKRLMRTSEKLMQLARAEGGRLQGDALSDIRPVLEMIVKDFTRVGEGRIVLTLPSDPVPSRLDPDAIGILFRNLLENALKHGAQDGMVEATLQIDGMLCVANDGSVLSTETMDRLMKRFERGDRNMIGSGLGLSIIKAIADRTGMHVNVISPRPMKREGVQVQVKLPLG